jgi:MoaA/NifB/PqqE/SkfB family radical SAM enzyme
MENIDYISTINHSIRNNYGNVIRIFKGRILFSYLFFFLKTLFSQRRAIRLRSYWGKRGIHVPPLMIASVTKRCNLKCRGCYVQVNALLRSAEIKKERWLEVIKEARDLGISFIILAGGEPLMRPELLNITRKFPEVIFLLFTNAQLINKDIIGNFKKQKNLLPIVSIEGSREETNHRRGKGVYEKIQKVITGLNSKGIPFGISATVTKDNFNTLTSESFVRYFIDNRCKVFFFLEYVPVEKETEYLVIDNNRRGKLLNLMSEFESKYPGLFITFPGNEEKFGGCLSAGRGFIHISPEGNLEPCPVAPYSDTNLNDISLKDALKSNLLRVIRQNHDKLSETNNGCALWNNRDWVRSLIVSKITEF